MDNAVNLQAFQRKIQQLPVSFQREAMDYVDFLIQKYNSKELPKQTFSFSWERALSEQEDMSSVELQHKAMEWR